MKNQTLFVTFCLVLNCFACKNPTTQNANNTVAAPTPPPVVTPAMEKPMPNFTCVPFQQVGLITANMTENDLKKTFGDSNVVRVNRGSVKNAVFPKSENEIEISWKKGINYKKIETVIIRKGQWRTNEGIKIGTTVDELDKINGTKTELYQLEDDYAIVRWKGGLVNPKLKIIVDTYKHRVSEMQIDF